MAMKAKNRKNFRIFLITIAALGAIAAMASCASTLAPCGSVFESARAFWAVREDKRIDLDDGDGIFEFDVLETDLSGEASVRFSDGAVLKMGNGTRIDVKEAVFSEERKRFNVGIAHGAARIITGEIARLNPIGFKVTTPKSIIGVRGTILDVTVSPDAESVTVLELSPGSAVTHASKITGEKTTLTMAGDSITITFKEITDPSTGEKTTAIVTETSGEGVLKGDRDARGFDRSGAGDNPRERAIFERRGGNGGDRGREAGPDRGDGGEGEDGGDGAGGDDGGNGAANGDD
jgi:hypothetical protein